MKKFFARKFLVFVLMFAMIFSTMPLAAFADEGSNNVQQELSNEAITNEAITAEDINIAATFTLNGGKQSYEYNTKIEKDTNGEYVLYVPDVSLRATGSSIPELIFSLPADSKERMEISYTAYEGVGTDITKEAPNTVKTDTDGKISIADWKYTFSTTLKWSEKITVSIGSGDDKKSYDVKIVPFLTLGSLYVKDNNNNVRPFEIGKQYENSVAPIFGQTEFSTTAVKGTTISVEAISGAQSTLFSRDVTVKINGDVQTNDNKFSYTVEDDSPKTVTVELSKDGFRTSVFHIKLFTVEKDYFPVLGDLTVQNKTTGKTFVNPKSGIMLRKSITQYDDCTITVDVLDEDKSDLTYTWTVANVKQDETGNTIQINTTETGARNYVFKASRIVDGRQYTVSKTLPGVGLTPLKVTPPTFDSQPQSAEYEAGSGAMPMVVKPKVVFGHTYEIQWYCNTENSTVGGTPIDGAIALSGVGSSYLPDISQPGTYYYYAGIKAKIKDLTSDEVFSDIAVIKVNPLENFLEGKGTEDSPYLIADIGDLNAIKEKVEKGLTFANTYFKFVDDIELPADWKPIGDTKDGTDKPENGINLNPFSGIIDGDNHTLTVAEGGLPLLGYVRETTVKNLNIYGKKIAGYALVEKYTVDYGIDGNYNTGCPQTATIENVTIKSGTQILKGGLIGGFGSGANTVRISNCTAEKGVVVGYSQKPGGDGSYKGTIGSFAGSLNGIVTNCVSYADVYGVSNVGGIAGVKGQSMGPCLVSNCEFYGTVNATDRFAGGILGAGYDGGGTAPNTPVATVKNCLVVGTINGNENVGGVFGGEPGCEDCWANGKGSVSENVFYGKINAKGENVGGIIGFMKSYNENQSMDNNYYLDTCGVDKGIGAVEIVNVENLDLKKCGTSATAKEMKDGSITQKLNAPEKSLHNWIQGEKYPVHSDKAVAFELTVGGEYKNEYYIGEDLNLEGIELTAKWSDGTTSNPDIKDVKITGYNKNTRGIQTVTLSYGAAKAEIQVTVLKKPTSGSNTIKVSFTLLGDSVHGDPTEATGTHTLKDKNLETWIGKTEYTVDLNATVWDVVQKALKDNNMTCDNQSGNYIASITRNGKTLGEFSNGNLSGWMYTLNGKHPLLGVSEQFLNNGDKIVFHYTDDYTKEEGSDKWNTGGGGTTVSASADDVIKLIDKIGTVTKDSGNAIKEARDAYDKLTDKEKAKVTNYAKLTAAEKAYADLNKVGENGFTDVKDHWAKDAINFVVEKQLFNGTTATTFEPETAMNRAMLVTVLWRLDGKPAPDKAAAFADVEKGSYYADAVAWANANGIVKGYSETQFAPNDKVTREQLAAILYRYAQFKGYDVSKAADLSGYKDFSQISAYAVDNMKWAAGAGIINGRTADTLASQGESTRAEVATMLMRFVQNVK